MAGKFEFEGPMEKEGKPQSLINKNFSFQAAKDRRGVEKIRFNIENLLSADNLMDPDSVGALQDMLNKYVHGEDKLKVDRILGPKTTESIRQYRDESRYWGGHKTIDIDPERTFRRYQGVETGRYNRESLREGSGY